MKSMDQNCPIHEWAAEDRPREKMMQRGIGALSDAEIIATLLATGTREMSAIDLGRKIIDHFGGLPNLSRATVSELTQIRGVGIAKASAIVASFELANRRMQSEHLVLRFDTSNALANYLMPKIGNLPYEVFHLIYLDRQNQMLGELEVFRGGVSRVTVDGQYVFKLAISNNASSIVVCHNHPTGCTKPSFEDDDMTQHLIAISEITGIALRDHLVVTHKGWYSYADQGVLARMRARTETAMEAMRPHPRKGHRFRPVEIRTRELRN